MKITFDAVPICSDKITGIGWCEVGQTQALAEMHPENEYEYSFFTSGDSERVKRVEGFAGKSIKLNTSDFSGYLYRAVSTFLPLPYSCFFGRKSDITHFFNYIVPPFVHGKKVVTVHDMVYKAFPETVRGRTRFMLEMGLKRSMKRADIIVTDSEFSKSEIVKYFPQHEKKIRVVPCGADPERTDSVLLIRERSSHIYYKRRMFDYPLKFSLGMLASFELTLCPFTGKLSSLSIQSSQFIALTP